jgi:hypothetical protein
VHILYERGFFQPGRLVIDVGMSVNFLLVCQPALFLEGVSEALSNNFDQLVLNKRVQETPGAGLH